MSVSSGQEVTVLSDFDETWHTYSLIFNSDFVERFFLIGGKEEKFALATVFNGF